MAMGASVKQSRVVIAVAGLGLGAAAALAALASALESKHASAVNTVAPLREAASAVVLTPIVPADVTAPVRTDWAPRTGDHSN
jgi:hypothetical protein